MNLTRKVSNYGHCFPGTHFVARNESISRRVFRVEHFQRSKERNGSNIRKENITWLAANLKSLLVPKPGPDKLFT